jgi:hypothetical protein
VKSVKKTLKFRQYHKIMVVIWRTDVEAEARWRDLKTVVACTYISLQNCNNVISNKLMCVQIL